MRAYFIYSGESWSCNPPLVICVDTHSHTTQLFSYDNEHPSVNNYDGIYHYNCRR